MQFHFFHLMPWTTYPEPPVEWPVSNKSFDPVRGQQLYRDYIDSMVYAEACGFDAIGCNEHHFSPYGLMSNCNVIGGALVYRTSNAKLAMFGNLVPLLNPIRVAEEYAMLDVMSGGRVIAGFMRGIPHEYIAYNIPPSESRARLREASALIIKAWTEPEPFGWEGEFYQFPSVAIWPKPFQKPHPPVLMSASNEESAEFAAAHRAMMGVSLIADLNLVKANIAAYKKAARAHGWEPGPQHILIGEQAVIADTDEEAHELMKGGLDYFHRILMRPQRDAQSLVLEKTRYFDEAGQGERFQKRLATLRSRTFEEQIEAGSILCGSPKTVVKQIKRIHDVLGMGVVQLILKIGNLSDAAVHKSLELFRDKVLPEVRGL